MTPERAFTLSALRARLLPAAGKVPVSVYLWLLGVSALGALVRMVNLGHPRSLVFDETYYVKDSYSMLQNGVESKWADQIRDGANGQETLKPNDLFESGDFTALGADPSFVVHPPFGKWLIAVGMQIFGADNSFGWRFSAALVGTLAIFVLGLVAYRLLHSLPLAVLAAGFFAVDGHAIVMSRTALLDIFLMFWVLLAFYALIMDRYHSRARLAKRLSSALHDGAAVLSYGPRLGVRGWRIAAIIFLGLALGTKWSAVSFIAVLGLLSFFWDANARKVAGVKHWLQGALRYDILPAVLYSPLVLLGTYLSTWSGWLLSTGGYNRAWAQDNPDPGWSWVPNWLRSLSEYHRAAYAFHQNLSSDHAYQSEAWQWLVMLRPTSFYFRRQPENEQVVNAITSLGNPLIWWAGAIAVIALIGYVIRHPDWRGRAILTVLAAGYLPWFLFPERTTFFFYSISFQPYVILALVFMIGALLNNERTRSKRLIAVSTFVVLVLLASAYFMPIWLGSDISYDMWKMRMFLPSWI